MELMSILQATILLGLVGFVVHTSAEDDSPCLKAFKNSVKDPNNYFSGWDFTNSSVCSFPGVQCWNPQENKVLSLKVEQAGLSGAFPSGLDLCGSLTSLSLAGNAFSGSLPANICKQVTYVTTLDLSANKFSGSIPDDLANCIYLHTLNLENNMLAGPIPGSIGTIPKLDNLDLSSNSLSGSIPSSFTNRSSIDKPPFPASAFQNNAGLCGPPLDNACSSGSSKAVPIGVAVGVALILLILGAFIMWWVLIYSRKKGSAYYRDEHKWAKRIKAPKSVTVSLFHKPIVKLRFSDLMAATNAFSKDNIIASGRTGTTYKATMRDGSVMSIKRLQMSSQTEKQFKSEMKILENLRQRNLVPLLGYCIAGGERLLVYKHMDHGSLRGLLHEVPEEMKPDFTTRLKVGIGAARGLAYLHHSCNPRVIHRNISASSILVDEDYEARITDFGLARLMNPVDTHISTFVNGDFGDVGYVAPEYVRTLVATTKGDVYSFGVVLLELLSGCKAMDVLEEGDFKGNLAQWVGYLSSNGRLQDVMDASLKGKGFDNELMQFLRVACVCVFSAPKERPTMYEVYQLLKAIGEKYNLTDENDEVPFLADTKDGDLASELIVAVEK